jgi:hypothetical protein
MRRHQRPEHVGIRDVHLHRQVRTHHRYLRDAMQKQHASSLRARGQQSLHDGGPHRDAGKNSVLGQFTHGLSGPPRDDRPPDPVRKGKALLDRGGDLAPIQIGRYDLMHRRTQPIGGGELG